jgi:hypothetical protein
MFENRSPIGPFAVAAKLQLFRAMSARRSDFAAARAPVAMLPVSKANESRPKRRYVEPKRVFVALDGRELIVGGRRWRIEVFSVRDLSGLRWIQLALKGTSALTFALKLDAGAGARRAVMAVTSKLMSLAGFDDVPNVA